MISRYCVKKRKGELMAKPIRTTPILTGDDAKRFLDAMFKKQESRITKKELELVDAVKNFRCEIR